MSSKRQKRRKQCRGKKRHKKIDSAFKARRALIRKYKSDPDVVVVPKFDVYWCNFCNSYHVGHSKHAERRY
jgi:hypothetical protein